MTLDSVPLRTPVSSGDNSASTAWQLKRIILSECVPRSVTVSNTPSSKRTGGPSFWNCEIITAELDVATGVFTVTERRNVPESLSSKGY